MAKNNKNHSNNRTAITVVAFVLAAVFLVVYVGLSVWKAAWNPAKWVSKPATDITQPNDTDNKPSTGNDDKDKPSVPDEPDTPTDTEAENDELLIEELSSNGISLLSMPIAHSADYISTQRVTVSVLPPEASNKEYDISFKWENASSTWAKGKNVSDYVDYTATSNPAEIDLNMKARFGEVIVGRFALKSNSSIYVNINLNCYKRITQVNLHDSNNKYLNISLTDGIEELFAKSDIGNTTYNVIADTTYNWDISDENAQLLTEDILTTGTKNLNENWAYTFIQIATSTELENAIKAAGLDKQIGNAYTLTDKYSTNSNKIVTWRNLFNPNQKTYDGLSPLFSGMATNVSNNSFDINPTLYAKLINCLKQCDVDLYMYVIHYTANNTAYMVAIEVNILDSSLSIPANGITTDIPEVNF